MRTHKTRYSKKIVLIVIGILALLAVGYFVFTLFYKTPSNTNSSDKTTSTEKTAQPDYNSGQVRQQQSSGNTQSPAVDAGGQNTSTTIETPSSSWTSSSSGLITVQQPIKNSTLKSGDTLRGVAKVPDIHYTLADNVSGVISQGSLSVVNGVFSGVLYFTAKGSSGQLSIFTFDPSSGAETNIINIPVSF